MKRLSEANLARSNRWHPGGIEDWSLAEWGVALAGEVGEACNIIKKMKRVEQGINQKTYPEGHLQAELAKELADVYIYLDLLAQRAHIDLEKAVVDKFNEVSIKYGFPERL